MSIFYNVTPTDPALDQFESARIGENKAPTVSSIQQKQGEAVDLLLKLAGGPDALSKLVKEKGRPLTFEEFVDLVCIDAIEDEQKKVKELLTMVENGGHPGLKGFVASQAANIAGVAGATLGGFAGGVLGGPAGAAAGAAVGQDVLKKAVGTATGYPADPGSPESRQLLMMRLDSCMKGLERLGTMATNIQEKSHQVVMNTIRKIAA